MLFRSYLELWRKYTEVEFDFIDQTKRQAGLLEYSIVDRSGCEAILKILNPEYAKNFLESLEDLGPERMVSLPRKEMDGRRRKTSFTSGRLIPSGERTQMTVRFQSEDKCYSIAAKGVMVPDIRAAEMQYDRREEAFQRIFLGKSAKPDLALLISGQRGRQMQEKRRMTAMSKAVEEACFPEHKPTENQRRAIELALNTPDFAIIQGPPGAGKTTVINAIMMALSEKEKDPELFFGKNLMTAYQKDATAHLAEKLRIYGLPDRKSVV